MKGSTVSWQDIGVENQGRSLFYKFVKQCVPSHFWGSTKEIQPHRDCKNKR